MTRFADRLRQAVLVPAIAAVLLSSVAAAEADEAVAPPPGKARIDGPMLREALDGPMKGVEEVLFVIRGSCGDHYYSPFGYTSGKPDRTLYWKGPSHLVALNLRTGKVRTILADERGAIRYPHVRHDARRIVMSYRPAGSELHHLYDVAPDGSDLRQITDGRYDDLDPAYLPDGDIVFASARCHCWVGCWVTQVAVLYRCGPDGQDIERLSANVEHESSPWPMPDGRVLFTRWEYTERALTAFHHLWTVNPDGTGAMTYYGNSRTRYEIEGGPAEIGKRSRNWLFIDAKPIPGSDAIVAILNPNHGFAAGGNRSGMVGIVRPDGGPDQQGALRRVSPDDKSTWKWRDPYPFSEDCFLACIDKSIVVMNAAGQYEPIYTLGKDTGRLQIHEPMPIAPRPVEPVVPSRVDRSKTTGTFILQDVTIGRAMDSVEPGQIKKLLVLELLPWGGAKPFWDKDNLGSSSRNVWNFERVVGTVPVEPDGSAHFQAPADRALFFACLDANDRCVKRMQSMVQVRPGEVVSCVGCHERRVHAGAVGKRATLMALQRPASPIETIPGTPKYGRVDFTRDIQPVLDKKCVACHGRFNAPRGVSLVGDRGPMFSHSYSNLLRSVGNVFGRSHGNTPAGQQGSGSSRLYRMLEKGHQDVKLTREELNLFRIWIDTGATYPGTYAAASSSRIFMRDKQWGEGSIQDGSRPSLAMDWQLTEKRCASCHLSKRQIERAKRGGKRKLTWPRENTWYNLDHPEKSMILLAPLAKEAGGLGLCKQRRGRPGQAPVFASKDDSAYRRLLGLMRQNAETFQRITTFERPGFVPSHHYVREMKRAGILDPDWSPGDPIDVYEIDEAYLRQYWPKGG